MAVALEPILNTLCDDPSCCRQRLIHAAGMLYAEHGMDRASTRQLAHAAGVNLAAIAYYFGGKSGLRDAVISHVVAQSRERFGGLFARLATALEDAAGDRALLSSATYRFVSDYLHACLTPHRETWWIDVLMSAMGDETGSDTQLVDAVFSPGFDVVCALVATATGTPAGAPEAKVLATSVIGEFLIFYKERWIVLRQLNWDRYTPSRIDEVVEIVAPVVLGRLRLTAGNGNLSD